MGSGSLTVVLRAGSVAFVLLAFPLMLFGRGPGGRDALLMPAEDSSYAGKIVARVGPKVITGKEFLLAYDFGPAFPKREKDSKRRFLQFMINEKLLALDAQEHGGNARPSVIRSVAEIDHDLATEELYRQDVLGKVHISRQEMEEAVTAQRIHYSLRWIYAPTRDRIEEVKNGLAAGRPFDSLYHASLVNPAQADDRSWQTTRFKLMTTRPGVAGVVDTMKPGRTSVPVEGPDGWYIFSLDNISFDAITTESDAAQQLHRASEVLTQHKADSLSDIYVDKLMREHAPVIERRTFAILCAFLGQAWLPQDLRTSMLTVLPVDREIAVAAAANPSPYASDKLVTMSDRAVTLGRFLAWYNARSTLVKLSTTSGRAFQESLERLIWQMVRDGLLIERAERRHLDKLAIVKEQKGWWTDKILYASEKQALSESIAVKDSLLSVYFVEHRARYAHAKGDTVTFRGAADEVRRDFVSEKMTSVLFHRLVELRRKYQVTIDEDVLASLPVDSANDPKAIDVYVAKKGGTFPHPAFPTIDDDWQTWQ